MNRNPRTILAILVVLGVAAVPSLEVTASPQGGRVVSRKSSGQQSSEQKKREPRARPSQPSQPEPRTVEDAASGPMAVFAEIERGWRGNNVDAILAHFGKSKVSISIEGTGPSGGKFSKSQSYYLLKDVFKYTITKRFEFVQYRKPNENGKTSFAVAERFYQKTDDGRLFKDKIFVSLHTEDGEHWVVNEIKSIR
jgi:hypothetical protein